MDISGLRAFSNAAMTGLYNGAEQISKNKGTVIKITSAVAVVALGVWLWNQSVKEGSPILPPVPQRNTPQPTPIPPTKVVQPESDECTKLLSEANKIKDAFFLAKQPLDAEIAQARSQNLPSQWLEKRNLLYKLYADASDSTYRLYLKSLSLPCEHETRNIKNVVRESLN